MDGSVSNFDGSGTTISVYEGLGLLTYDSAGLTAGTFSASVSSDKVVAGAASVVGDTAVYANVTNVSETSGSNTFEITGTSEGGSAFTQSKVQSFSVSSTGATGASAKSAELNTTSHIISYNPTANPSSIELSVTASEFTTPHYTFYTDGVATQTRGTGRTHTPTIPTDGSSKLYRVDVHEGDTTTVTLSDQLTVYGVSNGVDGDDAYTVVLTNEQHIILST